MSGIDEPLPREHAACIVRASEVMVKILDIQQQVADLNLMGIAAAASTVMGILEDPASMPEFNPRVRPDRNHFVDTVLQTLRMMQVAIDDDSNNIE